MKYYENMNNLEEEFVRENKNTINPCLSLTELGDPEASFMLGLLYWNEAPSDRFKDEGIRLLEIAAEKGNLDAAKLLLSISKDSISESSELVDGSDSHEFEMYEPTIAKGRDSGVAKKYYDTEDSTELFSFQAIEESYLYLILSMFGIIPALMYGVYALAAGLRFCHLLFSLCVFGLGCVFFFLKQRSYFIRFLENGISINRKKKNPVFIPRENLLGIRLFDRSLDLVHTGGLLEYQVEKSLLKANTRSLKENFHTYMSVFPSQYYSSLPELELKRQVIHHSYRHANYTKLVKVLNTVLIPGEEILYVSKFRNNKNFILIVLAYMVVSSFIARGLLIALPFFWLLSYRANIYLFITSKRLVIYKHNFKTTLEYAFNDMKHATLGRSGIILEGDTWAETFNIKLGERDILSVLADKLRNHDNVEVEIYT